MGFSKKNSIFILIFILSSMAHFPAKSEAKTVSFIGFEEQKDTHAFDFQGNSSIDGGALQLTPDTDNDNYDYINNSGRIFYRQKFRLWSSENDDTASFSSYFLMNIYRKEGWLAGEGLAFIIAPNFSIPDRSSGEWMGLTNSATDGNPANQIVAIEFDTKKQDYDPDDNHIGLNFNSIKSEKTVSLSDYGIQIAPVNGSNYSVWVEYSGETKLLQLYMGKDRNPKPEKPFLNETLNLRNYVNQESYFGFSGSTGSPEIQLNCVLEWNLTVEEIPRKRNLTWVIVGAGIGTSAVILIIVCVILFRRKSGGDGRNVHGALKMLPGMPREFLYKELKKATRNFSESLMLGKGGFGIVYKGIIGVNGENDEIAVKKFLRDDIKGKDDFLDELTIIHRLRYKHLVRLLGWCYEKGKVLLVYEYMPNGSLDKHLYESQSVLNWEYRYKILLGIASALQYLHNGFDQKVIHRDLKASNILLDSNFNARLGDFGLARALDNERNSYTELGLGGVQGTFGYVAPECFHTGKATPESDVFGFGAVVLEVVCGKSPGIHIQHNEHSYTLVDWVWMLHRERRILDAVDPRLENNYEPNEATRLLLLGLACSHPMASNRPQTQAIFHIIEGTLPPPYVPPFKPAFTWPSMAIATITSDSILSDITLSSTNSGGSWSVAIPKASNNVSYE